VVCWNGGQRVRKERGGSPQQGSGVGVLVVHRQDADGQEGGVGTSAQLGRKGPVHGMSEGVPVTSYSGLNTHGPAVHGPE
jgi:hypothetical protein